MTSKPQTMDGYGGGSLALARSTCLYVATKLGDLLDYVVIVGVLVPSLLVDQSALPWNLDEHAGNMDIDLGLSLALLGEERYRELGLRLKDGGFGPDLNRAGNPTSQRWRLRAPQSTTIDFLIPPSLDGDKGGDLRHMEPDFAAVITPGLHIVFQDRTRVELSGLTPIGEQATRHIWVCGAAALTVLKAIAFRDRGANKDAYDLSYVWGGLGIEAVARDIDTLPPTPTSARHWPQSGRTF